MVFAVLLILKYRRYRKKLNRLATAGPKPEGASDASADGKHSSIQLANKAVLPSPFLKSITMSTTLKRDPVLSWVASELASSDRQHSTLEQASSSSSVPEPSMPSTPGGSGSAYPMIDVNEITIHRLIGEGSYGRVFAASWQQTPVAFKLLVDPKAIGDEEAAKKQSARISAALEREANLMAGLRHPNTVLFLGSCAFPPGILTEYCLKGSLHEVLQQAKDSPACASELTWQRRLHVALDAAKGMLYLHSNKPTPVIHRDLKPANLLVTRDWTCKVG